MSTEGAPRTRAEARALRAAAEQAAQAAEGVAPDAAPDASTAPDAAPTPADAPSADAVPDAIAPASQTPADAAPPAGGSPATPPRATGHLAPLGSTSPASAATDTPRAPASNPADDDGPADRTVSPASDDEAGNGDPGSAVSDTTAATADPAPPPAGAAKPPASARSFRMAMLAVVGVLAIVAAGLGVVSLTQGPRISSVQVDPAEAIEASGSRVIITANQALAEVTPEQITVEPAVPFTIDAAGRGLGIRFTVPLDDATQYSISVADVVAANGGPSATLQTSFTTPAAEMFLLQRDANDDNSDSIFRTNIAGDAVPVFTAEKINDYRATASRLVVVTEDADGSHLLVMNLQGENVRELPLPGDGYLSTIQVSERGNRVGYLFSDRDLSEGSGRASVLVTQSLGADSEPAVMTVADAEVSVSEWQFVPDSAAVLFLPFDGSLVLDDLSGTAGAQVLGQAMSILGVTRGTYTAVVRHVDDTVVQVDLTSGEESPLQASTPDYGRAEKVTPFPGGTLRHIVQRDEAGLPTGQAIIRVADDGAATVLSEVSGTSSIVQSCASPSGQYAAVTVAEDLLNNPYDDLQVPLPRNLVTHLLDLRSGVELVALRGFDISWCALAPSL